jgi:PAS domain S-box-containing protein
MGAWRDPRSVVEGIEPAYLGLGRVFALARDAVIVGEASSGRIVLWNAAAESMFGYTQDEARSILIEDLVPDELKGAHRDGLARFAEKGHGPLIDSARIVELPAKRKDGGSLMVELTLTPLESDRIAGRFVMAIVRDITERKRMEEDLRHHAEQVEQSRTELDIALNELRAANQELTDLAAVAAHELANPLSVLMGFSSLLDEHWEETGDDEKKRYAAAIHRQVNRMSKLAADLLTMSRLESGAIDSQPCTVSVLDAIGRAVDDLAPSAQIDVICAEDLNAFVDPNHVQRMLLNYLSNAIKYGEPPLTVTAISAGGSIEIRVCDAGGGVAEDLVPRLFGRFVRGLRDGAGAPGSGLGLSIVRALARMNDGDAWYEANFPRGSRFCIRLPGADGSGR